MSVTAAKLTERRFCENDRAGFFEFIDDERVASARPAGRIVERNKEALARLVTREIGKPYPESLGEVADSSSP